MRTLLGNGNRILNANSEPPRDVNAGLDGDHHTRQEDLLLGGGNAWRLVDLKADAMPCGMREILR